MTTLTLWKEYKKTRSLDLKRALIKQYFKLVYYVIKKTDLKEGDILTTEDYYQFGILGLSEAIDRYDPKHGVKFETYAIPRIRGMILDELRKIDFIPRSVKESIKKFIKKENERRKELDQENLLLTDYLKEYQKISLSQPVNEDETLLDVISSSDDLPIDIVEKQNLKEVLLELIEVLSERQKLVIMLYYYEGMSYQEIADVLNVTVSRISQIHSEVIKKLRCKIKKVLR